VSLGDVLAEQPRGERGGRAAQLRPLQRHRPGRGLHRHRPVTVAGTGLCVRDGGGPLVSVTAQELGHLGLERSLQQKLRPEPGYLLQNLAQLPIRREQRIDLGTDTIGR
jgi:hypothetical protein